MQVGDSCELGSPGNAVHHTSVAEPWRPAFGEASEDGSLWTVYMLQGPQAAPDYFTEADMEVRPPPFSLVCIVCVFYHLFARYSLFPDHPATLHAFSRWQGLYISLRRVCAFRCSRRLSMKCTTTQTAWGSGSQARSHSLPAATAGRAEPTLATSTTTCTPSARSISRVTCRSSCAPMAPVLAALSARLLLSWCALYMLVCVAVMLCSP